MDIDLGPYRLAQPLGQGAAGSVFAATHRTLGHTLAIKLLPDQATAEAEVHAIAALDHRHIVALYDTGLVPRDHGPLVKGHRWIAMERAAGPMAAPRTFAELASTLDQVLHGLCAAHGAGTLHLDVKPSNVLVRHDGTHIVADFGLAQRVDDPRAHRLGGTLNYIAPERFAGRAELLVQATDIYSVGCMAYALACATHPFLCTTWAQSRRAHVESDPDPFRPVFAVPKGFDAWIDTALAKDPRRRHRTASAARAALRALADSIPIVGRGGRDLPAEATCATVPFEPESTSMPAPRSDPPTRATPPLPASWPSCRRTRRPEGVGLGLLGTLAAPHVGHTDAKAELWSALRSVWSGGPHAVAELRGPPGVGRSRLARDLCAAAAQAGAVSLRVRDGDVRRALRESLRVHPGLERGRVEEAARWRLPARAASTVADAVAGTIDAGLGLLECARAHTRGGRPVVVWFDDLHLYDAARAAMSLLRADELDRLLIVTTGPPSTGASSTDAIVLSPLKTSDVRALLADWVGLNADVVAHVAELTEGDVGSAIDVVTEAVRVGALIAGPIGLMRAHDAPLTVPAHTLDRWRPLLPSVSDPAIHDAICRAAVMGSAVGRATFERAVDDAHSAQRAEQILTSSGLVVADEAGFHWVSAVPRRLLIPANTERRAAHHRACALATDPTQRWRRGEHWLGAGDLTRACHDMIRSSGALIASGGMATAQRHLDRLQTALHDNKVPEHDIAWAEVYRGRAMLGPTHQGYAATLQHNAKVIEITSNNLGSPAHLLLHQSALNGNIWLANNQLLPRVAAPLVRRLKASGDPRAGWFDAQGWHELTLGRAHSAKRAFEHAVRLAKATNNEHIRYVAHTAVGVAMRHMGDPLAEDHLRSAGRDMLDAGYLSARADLAAALGDAARTQGHLDRALEHYDEAMRATAEGEARADLGFKIGRALLYRDMDRLDLALRELRACQAMLRDEGASWRGLIGVHTASVLALGTAGEVSPELPSYVADLLSTGFVDPDLRRSVEVLLDALPTCSAQHSAAAQLFVKQELQTSF